MVEESDPAHALLDSDRRRPADYDGATRPLRRAYSRRMSSTCATDECPRSVARLRSALRTTRQSRSARNNPSRSKVRLQKNKSSALTDQVARSAGLSDHLCALGGLLMRWCRPFIQTHRGGVTTNQSNRLTFLRFPAELVGRMWAKKMLTRTPSI
jgi:hypothetical protein